MISEYLDALKERINGRRTTPGTNVFNPQTETDVVVTITILIGLVLTVSTVAYAVALADQGETFTEFYLLTENETGDLTARNYPTSFRQGESKNLVFGIHNHERQRVRYTAIVKLQRVSEDGGTTTVQNETEQARSVVTISHNETRNRRVQMTPTLTGEGLRLVFLLYRGTIPDEPTVANAYRSVHLRIDVAPR